MTCWKHVTPMAARNPRESEVKGIYHLESIHFQVFLWCFRPVSLCWFCWIFGWTWRSINEINKSTDLGTMFSFRLIHWKCWSKWFFRNPYLRKNLILIAHAQEQLKVHHELVAGRATFPTNLEITNISKSHEKHHPRKGIGDYQGISCP